MIGIVRSDVRKLKSFLSPGGKNDMDIFLFGNAHKFQQLTYHGMFPVPVAGSPVPERIPLYGNFLLIARQLSDYQGEGIYAHRIEATLDQFVAYPAVIFKKASRVMLIEPGEVPHGYGKP
jgi:hypothetical protein